MSDIINLLPDNIANQIAAGEVIQRPASVVKELLENAVDAGATKIELHIKDAGKTLIQITDDGKGMSEMDAQMCFERHATSKITSADDLFSLQTKGFRGEALASIAAIAHVELETIEKGKEIGTKIEIAGSKITLKEPIPRNRGTSISVKNLFFNVPARRNFLKSDNIETKHIVEEFNRIVLTHPEIAFVFSHNGNILNNLESANLRKRIVDLFGKNFNTKLVPIEEKTDIVNIYGFIVKPEFSKKSRGEQYFFVNNRFFKDNYLHHAVNTAYENLIAPKYFPSYFIYLEVPSDTLDVNIHPTKTEVKFTDNQSLYRILLSTIRLALGKYNIAPSIDFEHDPQFDLPLDYKNRPIQNPEIKVDPTFNPFHTFSEENNDKPAFRNFPRESSGSSGNSRAMQPNREDWEDFYKIEDDSELEGENLNSELELESNFSANHSNRMQFLNNYLLVQVKSGILLIHINRAKERMTYDRLMHEFMLTPIVSQQLLFPYEFNLVATQKLEWENNSKTINRLGFEWEWNGNILALSSTPSILEEEDIALCIDGILEKITLQEIDKGEIVHELILSISSSSARRAPKKMAEEEINHFIDSLFQSEQHLYSPSGKKIMNTISIDDLNQFLC